MDNNLEIRQVVGQAHLIREQGNVIQITPELSLINGDVLTVGFGQNAWLVTQDNQQIDLIDNIYIVNQDRVDTITLPPDVTSRLTEFAQKTKIQDSTTDEQTHSTELKQLLETIFSSLSSAPMTARQKEAIVALRYETYLNTCYLEPEISLVPIPVTPDASAYKGRIVATIKLRAPLSHYESIEIANDPNSYFFMVRANMIVLTDEGAEALEAHLFSLDEISVSVRIKKQHMVFDATVVVPLNQSERSSEKNVMKKPSTILQPRTSSVSAHQESIFQRVNQLHEKLNIKRLAVSTATLLTGHQNTPITPPTINWKIERANPDMTFTVTGELPEKMRLEIETPLNLVTTRGECTLYPNNTWRFQFDDPTQKLASLSDNEVIQEAITFSKEEQTHQQLILTLGKKDGLPHVKHIDIGNVYSQIQRTEYSGFLPTFLFKGVRTNTTQHSYFGNFGHLSINKKNQWQYIIDPIHNHALSLLSVNELVVDSFTLMLDNTHPLELFISIRCDTKHQFSLTPTFIHKDSHYFTVGRLSPPSIPFELATQWGTFTVSIDGSWIYHVNNDALCKKAIIIEQLHLDEYNLSMCIGCQTINQELLFTQITTHTCHDAESNLSLSGGALYNQPHNALSTPPEKIMSGSQGKLTIENPNSWTYELHSGASSPINPLTDKETLCDTFTLSKNASSPKLQINMTEGINHPTLSAYLSFEHQSKNNLSVISTSGNLISSAQQDDIPTYFDDMLLEGRYGHVQISNNQWHYSLSEIKHPPLNPGEIFTDTFTITNKNHEQISLVISITGTSSEPVIFGNITGALETEKTNSIRGDFSQFLDNQAQPLRFANTQLKTGYGDLLVDDNQWEYTLNPYLIAFLPEGEIKYDSVALLAEDDTTHHIFISIVGTDEEPILHAQTSSNFDEHVALPTLSGTLNQEHLDEHPLEFANSKIAGAYGSLTIWDNHWTYNLDPDLNLYMQNGDVLSDLLHLPSVNQTIYDIDISINKKNEEIFLSCSHPHLITSDKHTFILSGDIKFKETADLLNNKQYQAQYGDFSLSDHHWVYKVDPELSEILAVGACLNDTITLIDKRQQPHFITITIKRTQDKLALTSTLSEQLTATYTNKNKKHSFTEDKSATNDLALRTENALFKKEQQSVVNFSSTPPLTSDEDAAQSTIIVEKLDYPSVSGKIYLNVNGTHDNHSIADCTIEGKYGRLTIKNNEWRYAFSPDKVLPYSAETTEAFHLQDGIANTHLVIFTIESGMKKPVVTDVIIQTQSESEKEI